MSLKPYVLSLSIAAALTVTAGAHAARFDQMAIAGVAKGLARQQSAALQADSDDAFEATDVIVDADGTEHVRMQRSYRGLPVIGGDFVTHARGGRLASTSLTLTAPLRLSLRPTLTAEDAVVAAGVEFGSDFIGRPDAALAVYARTAKPMLAWQVRMPLASLCLVICGTGIGLSLP